MLGELARTYIDFDETRARIEMRIAAESAKAAEALAQSESEASAASESYRRVQRAFQDGIIEADDCADQRPGLIAEREAAEAEVARVGEHVAELSNAAPLLDAEERPFAQSGTPAPALFGVEVHAITPRISGPTPRAVRGNRRLAPRRGSVRPR